MRASLSLLAFGALLAPFASAQVCGTGQLLKNDNLPAVPTGLTGVSVIAGLCPGEACAAVFDVSTIGAQVQLNEAAVGLFAQGGINGNIASVDLEVFDGVTWNGSIPTLGPSVFRYSNAVAGNLQVMSHGINTSPGLSSFNINVSSGTMVVAWWMLVNPNGSCAGGYNVNFGTDNSSFQVVCTSAVTPPRKNLIYIQGQGWRDAATATVQGVPLCPLFYSGNWVIRACVSSSGCPAPLVLGQGTLGSGNFTPSLTAIGLPQVGNSSFGVKIDQGLGGAPAVLIVNGPEVNIPFAGGTIFVLPGLTLGTALGGLPNVAGTGVMSLLLPIPANPANAGMTITGQSAVLDNAGQLGLALTNGLRITICP